MSPPGLEIPAKAEQAKQLGNELFAKGKFNAAIDAYTEARLICPKWAVPLVNRALCHRNKACWAAVVEDCRKALELDPQMPKAYYMLGLAMLEEHKYAEAVKALTRALELAFDRGTTMLDDIWKELARAKYAVWTLDTTAKAIEYENRAQSMEQYLRMQAMLDLQKAQERHASDDEIATLEIDLNTSVANLQQVFREARKDDIPGEIPDWCICKLTMEPFRDPVMTPAGFSYERAALFEHFRKLGRFDPVVRSTVNPEHCYTNLSLRSATRAYLDSHGWAWAEYLSEVFTPTPNPTSTVPVAREH